MRPFTIALNNIRRMLRDRSNIFFVFMFPMLLILVIGATFGGGFTPRLAVVEFSTESRFAPDIVASLGALDEIEIEIMDTRAMALEAVERGRVNAAVVIPVDYDESVIAGAPAVVEFMARQDELAQQLRSVVDAVVAEQASRFGAAAAVSSLSDLPFDTSLAAVDQATGVVAGSASQKSPLVRYSFRVI